MSMSRKPSPSMILLLAFLCIQYQTEFKLSRGSLVSSCIESERNALLDFKHGLRDDTNRLSSWNGGEYCCNWEGITCNNKTRRIVRLDLRNPHPFSDTDDQPYNKWSLGGQLRPSLLGLKHLKYLDLSMNNFGGSTIPEFIGSLRNLGYLNLSRAGLGGPVPRQLGNLTRLVYLDLYNDLDPSFIIPVREFSVEGDAFWISGLSSIQHLILENVKFQNVRNWAQALNMLPSVVEIRLSLCEIGNIPLSLPHVNFTYLSVLDLSYNFIDSALPSWLFNVSSLAYLDLSENQFRSSIPAAIGNLNSLNVLTLSGNQLEGGLPKEVGNLCKLQTLVFSNINISRGLPELEGVFSGCIRTSIQNLDLTGTELKSYLPNWLWGLRLLKKLYLGSNLIVGSIPESLGRLTSLEELLLSNNELSGTIPESLGRLTSLKELSLSGNHLNGTIPESLGRLSEIYYLDISSNQLEGIISEVHLANLSKLVYLDLSSNNLALKMSPDWVPGFQLSDLRASSCNLGPKIPAWIRNQTSISYLIMSNAGIIDTVEDWFWSFLLQISEVDISNNAITGRLPDLSSLIDLQSSDFSNVEVLDLSNNSFSGVIDPEIGMLMPNLIYLALSENKLSGDIPLSLCQLQNVATLDLSRNLLSGEVPNCWKYHSREYSLTVIDMSSNNLSGVIPDKVGSLSSLEALHLSNNSLSGEIPLSLGRCRSLTILDLAENKFTGTIPTWIGENSLPLKILRLRSNMFLGSIPPNLSKLGSLQILDLGNNNLSGTIPESFRNFTAMKVTRAIRQLVLTAFVSGYEENLEVQMKGRALSYGDSDENLSLVAVMDLSDNNLSGSIPRELGELCGLLSLSLSGNHLNGKIPEEIGMLQSLVSLDLSRNNLSGAIPSTLASLTYLSYLDLSYNNLSGRIPQGNQLQTLTNVSNYIGNPGLCGFPLEKTCMVPTGSNVDGGDESGSEMVWFYVGLGTGFVVGFWAVFGIFLLKKNWRVAYFTSVDRIFDWVYVIVAVNFNRVIGS